MDLKDQSGFQSFPTQSPIHLHHGNLDDIGSRSLNGTVHGCPLAKASLHEIRRGKLRNRTSPPIKSCHIARLSGLCHRLIQKRLHTRIRFKILVNIFQCLLAADTEILAESEGADPVNNPEIHRLGISPLELRHLFKGRMEHLRSRDPMDILLLVIRLYEPLIP